MKLTNNLHLEDVALAFPSNVFFKRLHFLHDVFLRTENYKLKLITLRLC